MFFTHYSFQIKRIQQEALGRSIPDKPPPPYTPPPPPPSSSAAAERTLQTVPKQIEKHVPSSKDEISGVVAPMAQKLYASKFGQMDASSKDDLAAITDPSKKVFVAFLYELVAEIFEAVYSCEAEEQNPPWMPQKSLAKERLSLPKTEAQLVSRVQREALIFFGMEKRAGKENLIVRWSQKKRDRVDQILVRELHTEEASWIDYSKDEALVKDQLSEAIMNLLVQDTVKEMARIRR